MGSVEERQGSGWDKGWQSGGTSLGSVARADTWRGAGRRQAWGREQTGTGQRGAGLQERAEAGEVGWAAHGASAVVGSWGA